ncbi:hypothetical protein RCG17_01380 [Neobacillus sp. PS3-12]|jgi:NADPH:quinone reductase|uniref:hypothetical protein n=1 Tax=Neobacillus sp. PS3-12 TaxID=3070677 RepID=UPI0027E164ED|nr:hypothetical protein [Neobacillus sp. PS3-12]WML53387.1 hypothetical protein RCG17_01380 [Neobacillus sp. PS3-12]
MKAVVLEKTCTASELAVQEVPIPKVKSGWVLVKINAFGINRSEIFTIFKRIWCGLCFA